MLRLFITIIFILFSLESFASLDGGSSSVSSSSSIENTGDFTESTVGIGFAIGKRIDISTNIFYDIFVDEYDNTIDGKNTDQIFAEIEAFGNHNLSGEINQDYGLRLNLGYKIDHLRLYPSLGYLRAKFDYVEDNLQKQSISTSAPFVGFGIGYDINNSLGLRLNYAIYSIDFQPEGSSYDNVEVDVSTLNLNLAFHF